MSADPNCIFCKIIAGQIPASVVHQDEHSFAFMDIAPLSEGHLLLIPKLHCERLADLPPELAAELSRQIPRIGQAVLNAMEVDGFNVLVNDGEVAGQLVKHVHFHFIPRRPKDGLGYRWHAGEYAEGRRDQLQARYQKAMKGLGSRVTD